MKNMKANCVKGCDSKTRVESEVWAGMGEVNGCGRYDGDKSEGEREVLM